MYKPEPQSTMAGRWGGDLDGLPPGENLSYTITPGRDRLLLSIFGRSLHSHVYLADLPRLLNFYRDLGEAIDHLQPGIINHVPPGDPDEVEAMKVIHEADRLNLEASSGTN